MNTNIIMLLFGFGLLSQALEGQVTYMDFSEYFQSCNVKGSITIYDYNNSQWIRSDSADSYYETLPASTFKILHTLIALETGTIKSVNDTIQWPGKTDTTKYGNRTSIFRDMTVREAFEVSAGWVYVEIAKQIGKDQYKRFLELSNYGNLDIGIEDPDFWNFGAFAVSPVNQIELLVDIHEENLPFSQNHMKSLKKIMISEKTDSYILRSKTGWTRFGGKNTGWWVGYIEKKENVYFFATRIIQSRKDKTADFGQCRISISRDILKELGIL